MEGKISTMDDDIPNCRLQVMKICLLQFSSSRCSRGFISVCTPWTSLVIWPVILICVPQYRFRNAGDLMGASFLHLFFGAFGKLLFSIPVFRPQSSRHADALCGRRSQLNPGTSREDFSTRCISFTKQQAHIFLQQKLKKEREIGSEMGLRVWFLEHLARSFF